MDLIAIRTALLISLAVLALLLAWRLFKQRTMARDLPAINHAELLVLEVAYHPARLRVRVAMPAHESIRSALLGAQHEPLHAWDIGPREPGTHELELLLPMLPDGDYHFELSTATQRTVRRFRLQQA